MDELYFYVANYASSSSSSSACPCKLSVSRPSALLNGDKIFESFLNHPPLAAMYNPVIMLNIQQHQFQDLPLNHLQQQHPDQFPVKFIDNWPLICYCENPNVAPGD
eukprot:2854614-Ditylum_brightwellii.AAC.1